MKNAYGTGLCAAIGALAVLLSQFVLPGSVAIAIVLGIALGNTLKPGELFAGGIAFSSMLYLFLR